MWSSGQMLFSLVLILGVNSAPQVQRYTGTCDEDLSRLQHQHETISFGGQTLDLASGADLSIINSIRRDLKANSNANVIIYMFVEGQKGMATLRFETQRGRAPLEKVARQTEISPELFRESLAAAIAPSSQAERMRLRAQLLPTDMSADVGKTILFYDTSFYGTMPRSFELDNGFVFGSDSVKSAVAHVQALNSYRLDPSDITAFIGYPESDSDVKVVFGTSKTTNTEIWQQRGKEVRRLGEEYKFRVMGLSEMRSIGSKEALLDQIANSRGIVWIIAHSDGCWIRLATGQEVQISPADIRSLKLTHSPFVMIRVCNAADSGFAEAFLEAGARAVWVNKGIITASEVNQQLSSFLEALPNTSIAGAIKKVDSSSSYFRNSTLYVEMRSREVEGTTNGNE